MRIVVLVCALSMAGCANNAAPDTAAAPTPVAERTDTQSADIAKLRGITSVLIDASTLYAAAADEADNAAYQTEIRALSGRRRAMADRFQARVMTIGGAPEESGEALGTAHRVFMEARLRGEDDTKVAVEEALRGENYLLDQLTEASNDATLSSQTRAFVAGEIAPVRADRDQLEAYKNSLG